MSPKNLYVVTSLHYANPEENAQLPLEAILEIRLSVIKAIANVIRRAFFYIDSMTKEVTTEVLVFLQTASLEHIDGILDTAREDGEMRFYDIHQMVRLIRALRDEGIQLLLRETEEVYEPQDVVARYPQETIEQTSDLSDLSDTHSAAVFHKRLLALRDRKIVKRIEETGAQENILFMGEAHRLATLQSSSVLRSYRLHVMATVHEVIVNGRVPKKFRSSLESMVPSQTADGKKTALHIDYV